MILKKKMTQGAGLPPSGGTIHVYITIIFKDFFSLKPFGQSKPNVLLSILRKGE